MHTGKKHSLLLIHTQVTQQKSTGFKIIPVMCGTMRVCLWPTRNDTDGKVGIMKYIYEQVFT